MISKHVLITQDSCYLSAYPSWRFNMKIKTTLAALVLGFLPGMAFAAGCSWHQGERTANACAEGEVYDADMEACITPATS
jgi:hypothetical protein